MSIRVPVYQPGVLVTLYKTVKRESLDASTSVSGRFKLIEKKVDLTAYLGEGSSLRTSKSVREPAGGFALTLADKAYDNRLGADTLYGIIEPMDLIEIRMSRSPGVDGVPPIVMRGFVSEVQRSEAMTPEGRPIRAVTVNGQDYGKLWQMLQILYLPGYVVGQDTISAFRLFEKFGAAFETSMTGRKFLTEVVEKILNPYVEKLMPKNFLPNLRKIIIDEKQLAKHGTTSVSGPQNREGSIYDLLRTYLDVGIWNELFLEDREDGVYCVWRANPYKTVAGEKIQSDAPDAEVIDVPGEAVVSMSVSRSDANVANFYWARSPIFDLNSDLYRRMFSIQNERETVDLSEYPNAATALYGIRVMYVDTMMGGDDVKSVNSGQKEADHKKRDTSQMNWINRRRQILVEQNKDNVIFERGSLRIRGDERIRAGMYARLHRGQFSADYYVVQVSHDYVPFQGFFSTLTVERGRGFIERAKRDGGSASPYYAEMS